jgi:uncharacterized membrane protein YuzA (DUF378 family)
MCYDFGGLEEGSLTMKWLNIVTLALAIIGGLNWGFVALGGYNFDVLANVFGGSASAAARVAYALVGLAALWQILPWVRSLRTSETEAEVHRMTPAH